ncbi:hypothetical protein [Thermofilum sp.]|uniref:hypothetical protein n=1 Tax=Thermofilum sp. TaxID=1961369 RepID=UPI00258F40A5|nr:hypothetical protein [Thermofilum sp.]
MERAFCAWLFFVILFCYLAFSFLTLAGPGGSGSPQLIQPAQPYYDPDYVSPGPAEFASLSISIGTRICPLSNAPGCIDVSRGRISISALEYGPFTAGWLAYYAGTQEWVWTSPQFSGPGLILFNVSSVQVREGYLSFGFPLFVLRGGKTVWVQSIDIIGLDKANAKCLCLPTIKDVTLEEHGDLGGIVVHVFMSSPSSSSIFRLRVYWGGKLVYDFLKEVSIPEEWEHSPIEIRVDFGPIILKKPGTYTIQADVSSDGTSDSKILTYTRPAGQVKVSINDPYGASWRVTWSGEASGSKTGSNSEIFTIQVASQVNLWAEILSNPPGYTCTISPSFATAKPGDSISFTVDCTKKEEPTEKPNQSSQPLQPPLPTQQPTSYTAQFPALLILTTALSLIAITISFVALVVILKRQRRI